MEVTGHKGDPPKSGTVIVGTLRLSCKVLDHYKSSNLEKRQTYREQDIQEILKHIGVSQDSSRSKSRSRSLRKSAAHAAKKRKFASKYHNLTTYDQYELVPEWCKEYIHTIYVDKK